MATSQENTTTSQDSTATFQDSTVTSQDNMVSSQDNTVMSRQVAPDSVLRGFADSQGRLQIVLAYPYYIIGPSLVAPAYSTTYTASYYQTARLRAASRTTSLPTKYVVSYPVAMKWYCMPAVLNSQRPTPWL
eukprot:3893972-Rhodomonas_salina.2